MREQLEQGTIAIGDYNHFMVRDPKERRICAASFRERVLHHAIMNVCEPVLERYAIHDSFACRKGKGMHRAVRRAQSFCRTHDWCLKLDIAKYFDSVDHGILLGLLARRFKDARLLDLFAKLLAGYETGPGKGLPIGNLTSQHFANYYLGLLDHEIKEHLRVPGYVRYMDDMLVWGESREELKGRLGSIRAFLRDRLALKLKEGVQLKHAAAGVSFLGFRIFPWRIALARRSRRRFVRKHRLYEQWFEEGVLEKKELARRVEALVGFTRLADAAGFRRKVLQGAGRFRDGELAAGDIG